MVKVFLCKLHLKSEQAHAANNRWSANTCIHYAAEEKHRAKQFIELSLLQMTH